MISLVLVAVIFIVLTFFASTCKRKQGQYTLQSLVDMSFALDKNLGDYDIEEGNSSKTIWRSDKPPLIMMRLLKDDGTEYDNNTIMLVFIHELSHLACKESGHGSSFKNIERELINRAIKLNYLEENQIVDPTYPCMM